MGVNTDDAIATQTVTVKYIEWGEYKYFASFCLSFGYRAVPTTDDEIRVTKIWADGQLIYEADLLGNQTFGNNIQFYFKPGTEDQTPAPGQELAYRGQILIWFFNYCLGDSASIPAFTAEISDVNGITLADALEAFSVRAGYALADIDIDPNLDYPIIGYVADGQATLNGINTNLGFVYNFTGVEVAGRIIFKSNYDDNGDAVVQWTIAEEDLAIISESSSDQQIDIIELAADQGLPRSITASYYDPSFNYDQNTQTVQRSIGSSGSQTDVSVTLPIVAEAEEVRAFLTDALSRSWDQRNGHSLRLPRKYMGADPGDVIQWTANGATFTGQIQQGVVNADLSVSVSVAEIAVSFEPIAAIEFQPPATPVPIIVPHEVNAVVLDLPDWSASQVEADVLNLRVAMGGYTDDAWSGARLDMTRSDQPNGWAPRLQLGPTQEVGIAALDATPAAWAGLPGAFDGDTVLTVRRQNMPLSRFANATDPEIAAGANLLAVGREGFYELLQFKTVTPVDADTVELSDLYRGLYGTEDNVNKHTIDDVVVFTADLHTITYSTDDFANKRSFFYRGVSPLMDITDAEVKFFRPLGNSRRPYSPDNVTGLRLLNGDLIFTWDTHNRFAGEPDSVWSIDIFNADWTMLVARVSNIIFEMPASTGLQFVYFIEHQFIDGVNELDTINALVYQMNTSHGVRGFPGGGTLTPTTEGILSGEGVLTLIGTGAIGHDILLSGDGVLTLTGEASLTGGAEIINLAGDGVLSLTGAADLLVGGLSGDGVLALTGSGSLSVGSLAPIARTASLGVYSTTGPVNGLRISKPAGTVAGDLLLWYSSVFVTAASTSWRDENLTGAAPLPVEQASGFPDAGFTRLHEVNPTNGAVLLAWKIAEADEPDEYRWATWEDGVTLHATGTWHGILVRVTNFHEADPILGSAVGFSNSNVNPHVAPSVAGADIDDLLVNMLSPLGAITGAVYGFPSSMVELINEYVSTNNLFAVGTRDLTAAGATGSKSYTPPSAARYGAGSIVVRAQPFLSGDGVLALIGSGTLVDRDGLLLDSIDELAPATDKLLLEGDQQVSSDDGLGLEGDQNNG